MTIDIEIIRQWQFGVAGVANLVAFDCDDIRAVAKFNHDEDAKRATVAFQALDVMMRRQWFPIPGIDGRWRVAAKGVMDNPYDHGGFLLHDCPSFQDPYTALVEADKWYRENIERKH